MLATGLERALAPVSVTVWVRPLVSVKALACVGVGVGRRTRIVSGPPPTKKSEPLAVSEFKSSPPDSDEPISICASALVPVDVVPRTFAPTAALILSNGELDRYLVPADLAKVSRADRLLILRSRRERGDRAVLVRRRRFIDRCSYKNLRLPKARCQRPPHIRRCDRRVRDVQLVNDLTCRRRHT